MDSGGIGGYAGFSAGCGFVLVTGFDTPRALNGYAFTGSDWSFSIGGKVKALANLPTLSRFAGAVVNNINKTEDIIKMIRNEDKAAEVIGIGKSTVAAGGFDWEEKNINVMDIPTAGGGAEAGIYWYAAQCRLLSTW